MIAEPQKAPRPVHKPKEANALLELGTEDFPISIYNEEEEKDVKERRLEKARNATILQKAKLSGDQTEIILSIIKTRFRGTMRQKELGLLNEIVNYFNKEVECNIVSEYFAPRLEPCEEMEAKPTNLGLMVHGVDFLDTPQIVQMFTVLGQNPKEFVRKIHWYDDSNCLVTFKTPEHTELALKTLMLDPGRMKGEEEDEKEWYELKPYDVYGVKRQIFARKASENELLFQKKENEEINQFKVYQRAKEALPSHLLQKFKASAQFDKFMAEIEI